MNVGTQLEQIANQFEQSDIYFGHGTDNAWDEAVYLVFSVCAIPFTSDEQCLVKPVSPTEQQRIAQLAEQRILTRKPMAYILRQAWFCGYSFYVDERVLVPRSPLAELIDQEFRPWVRPNHVMRVLDLCTGSGCIGIATALSLDQTQVTATDICPQALAVAAINKNQYQLPDNKLQLLQSDLFEQVTGRFDLIISNPPYVDAEDMSDLPAEYQQEPADLALASGPKGLDCTNKILAQAADYLTEHGTLIVEVGNSKQALIDQHPNLPFIWLEFANGGDGVFVLGRSDLLSS